ncbi:FtsK/SpoIIIE domain-containing protein [Hydrogenophaga luteola]|uniref:FtsK/SpoIIIE domain-containing protein n=1 Tax=Hydrogenophaga luteola TaxID=1591122 RepID=A0ABV7WA88_9BURK
MTSDTLARAATQIAVLVLKRDASAAHQCFRVKNLHADEVLQFVNWWPDAARARGLEKVRLIVADSLNGSIPSAHVAEPGCSITHYRNNNPDGLVYIETSVQSDEQGLQNMFSLRDSNFLDGSFDEYVKPGSGVPELLVTEAWRVAGGVGPTPALLLEHLLRIVRLVHPAIEPVPVRRFIGFIEEAARQWVSNEETIDPAIASCIVGDALWAMDMFPDPLWNEGAEARWRRRLELNSRHADLIEGSTELDAEAIETKALATKFVGRDGEALPFAVAQEWRRLCIAYGANPSSELRRQIPYEVFNQLFSKDLTGLRLGDRVRAELAEVAPDRLGEFDALDVTGGLNTKSSHDANRLLDASPPPGLKPLADLLSGATRKSLERLAAPPRKRFFNPIIEIIRQAQRVSSDTASKQIAVIELALQSEHAEGTHMQGLFAFLFGETLRSVATTVEGVPGSCQLVLQHELISQVPAPALVEDLEDDEEESEPLQWDPLLLRFTFRDPEGRILEVMEQMEWLPPDVHHFAFLWLLAVAEESPALDSVGMLRRSASEDSADWLTSIVQRETSLETLVLSAEHVLETPGVMFQELVQLRRQLRSEMSVRGLELGVLQAFLDKWQAMLKQARESLVPDGVRSRELDALLGCDMLAGEDIDRRMMLALHPIRLRWICSYLEQTMRLSEEFLSREAAFADGEGSIFLDWLERLTPREAPPIAAGSNGQLLYSKAEVGWCEDFSSLDPEAGDIAFDNDAIASIAHRISSYLDTHPYKRDGLSILVVLPTSDGMPGELLKRIIAKTHGPVRIFLSVAAPKTRWEAIARSVESISEGADSSPRIRLFPDRDLAFMDFRAGQSISELLADLQIDIGIVTHVLQEQIVSQQNTEAPIERPGVHNPLLHRPLRLEGGGSGSGSAISLVMLPKYPDPILESWSTLVVRANRSRPVAPGQPENTDFVELRVNFQDSARLFKDLHEHCHWVITLERHISRDQIESEEAGSPDVLSIEDGIGANRLNTLIVSSRSGRELIHSRLVRKLRRLVPVRRLQEQPSGLLSELANGIYESIRQIAPRLALQALGVARVTEEIVGLTVARNLVEDHFPPDVSNGLVAWVSLDEHAEWFGGHAQVRADMCRLTLERGQDGALEVDVLVLEGKLRQLYDGHGVLQVSRTCEFFESILGDQDGKQTRKVDHLMWRELLASAIERLAKDTVEVYSPEGSVAPEVLNAIRDLTISNLRSGSIRLRGVNGVYSACLWDNEDEQLVRTKENGVTVLKSTRSHLIDLVRLRNRRIAYVASVAGASTKIEGPEQLDALAGDGDSKAATEAEQVLASLSRRDDRSANDERNPVVPDVPPFQDEARPQVSKSEEHSASAPAPVLKKGLSQAALQRMYEDILGCFGQHQISVFAAARDEEPFTEGPASILFKLKPGSGIDPRKLSEKGAALKLVLELEQEQNVSFNIDRGFVTIDVPKRPEHRYFVDGAETWTRWQRPANALSVPIGEDRFGSIVEFNFSSANSPHLLVAGTTGSGKSEALNTILFGLTRHYTASELRLMLVDPKGTELAPFEGSVYLEGQIGWDDADSLALLQRAVAEMQRRYVLFREASTRSLVEFNAAAAPENRLPWWVIVLDEYADLTHDPQSKKEIEAELKRLAQKARAAGIHVIIATQKPSADVISTNLRSNLPAQLALRVKSATESRVVIDEAGAENLNGKGDALLKADGKLVRVQCSRVNPAVWSVALEGPLQKAFP